MPLEAPEEAHVEDRGILRRSGVRQELARAESGVSDLEDVEGPAEIEFRSEVPRRLPGHVPADHLAAGSVVGVPPAGEEELVVPEFEVRIVLDAIPEPRRRAPLARALTRLARTERQLPADRVLFHVLPPDEIRDAVEGVRRGVRR